MTAIRDKCQRGIFYQTALFMVNMWPETPLNWRHMRRSPRMRDAIFCQDSSNNNEFRWGDSQHVAISATPNLVNKYAPRVVMMPTLSSLVVPQQPVLPTVTTKLALLKFSVFSKLIVKHHGKDRHFHSQYWHCVWQKQRTYPHTCQYCNQDPAPV